MSDPDDDFGDVDPEDAFDADDDPRDSLLVVQATVAHLETEAKAGGDKDRTVVRAAWAMDVVDYLAAINAGSTRTLGRLKRRLEKVAGENL